MPPIRNPRILFQEDDLLIRISGEEALRQAGMEVFGVGDNESARRAIMETDHPFDIIVLNGRLPDGKGIPLCAELRRAGVSAPVLMQSGDCYLEVYRAAMRAGVNDYLDKPWSQRELLERVQLLLDIPPLRHLVSAERGSAWTSANTPTVQSYCDDRLRSARAHLAEVRPIEGTLLEHALGTGADARQDIRAVALSEAQADDLVATLKAIERHLAKNAHDESEQIELRAKLLEFISVIAIWLGKRAEVATDESIKAFVKIGVSLYLAHLAGLKIDLLQILTALGLKVG